MSDGAPRTSDADLVRQCRDEGRPEAFEELMNRYHARVYAVIARLVSDPERARDLTQETFLKAWRALGSFEGQSAFYTWIYRIARNLVNSDHRRVMARPRVTLSLHGHGDEDGGGDAVEVEDATEEPETEALRSERRRLIVEAIRGLVPDFREIIVLRDIEKYSYEDIAELLEIPVGTVRSRLHRARLELKTKLQDILT